MAETEGEFLEYLLSNFTPPRVRDRIAYLDEQRTAFAIELEQLRPVITQLKADLTKAEQKHISGYWACSKCDNIEFVEREVKCWKCGKGEMLYQDKNILKDFIRQATEAFRNLEDAKAALTAAYDAGWNEGVEAAADRFAPGRFIETITGNLDSECIRTEIRRLRKEKGQKNDKNRSDAGNSIE